MATDSKTGKLTLRGGFTMHRANVCVSVHVTAEPGPSTPLLCESSLLCACVCMCVHVCAVYVQ